MPPRYRYNADKGCEVPVETEEERYDRLSHEEDERRERALRDDEERARRIHGPYL